MFLSYTLLVQVDLRCSPMCPPMAFLLALRGFSPTSPALPISGGSGSASDADWVLGLHNISDDGAKLNRNVTGLARKVVSNAS